MKTSLSYFVLEVVIIARVQFVRVALSQVNLAKLSTTSGHLPFQSQIIGNSLDIIQFQFQYQDFGIFTLNHTYYLCC